MNESKISLLVVVAATCLVATAPQSLSYDEAIIHPMINEKATRSSVRLQNALVQLGLSRGMETQLGERTVLGWVRHGGTVEDIPDCRTRHHFHDPLRPWEEAGFRNALISWYCGGSGDSSLVWAQGGRSAGDPNYSSWDFARLRYAMALRASTEDLREEFLAEMFLYLGQLMHLVSDASVPAHVRNDSHAIPFVDKPRRNYEQWTKVNQPTLSFEPLPVDPVIFSRAVSSGLAASPVSALWDIDRYTGSNPGETVIGPIGIAEYTNANFFSEDTVFKGYPHPTQADTNIGMIDWTHPELVDAEDGKIDRRIYIKRTVGNEVTRLLAVGYFFKDHTHTQYVFNRHFDDAVFREYASKLVPRAVGYSTGLLDYFFRGVIGVFPPTGAVYAMTDDPSLGFRKVRLQVSNVTANNEEMTGGKIALVLKFKTAQADPFRSGPVPISAEFRYVVAWLPGDGHALPRDMPVELEFDLCPGVAPAEPCPNAVPVNATDVYLQVVYEGQLGAEQGAIAVGFKDVTEPTPIDIFNNADMICLAGNWYVAGSPEAIALVDSNGDGRPELDVYPHDVQNIYIKISPPTTPMYASPEDYTYYIPEIKAGQLKRVYGLTDDHFFHSDHVTKVKVFEGDPWGSVVDQILGAGVAIKRQEGWEPPVFYRFRGLDLWGPGAVIIVNREFPLGTSCPFELLQ